MAELANRDSLARKFGSALKGINAKRKAEFRKLLGTPPDAKNIPKRWWDEVRKETEEEALALLLLIFLASYDAHRTWGDMEPPATNERRDKIAERWTQKRAATLSKDWVDHSVDMLDTANREWSVKSAEGSRIPLSSVNDLIDKIFGPRRAELVGITETGQAMVNGGDAGIVHTGVKVTRYWSHSSFRPKGHSHAVVLPCKICTRLEGRPESQWGGHWPGEVHPNCILPGNLVLPMGDVVAASKSLYDGICVEITLGNGSRFSVTQNHPVFTSRGLIAANLIRKGMDVFGTTDLQRVSRAINPNNNHSPTEIEQVFRSLQMTSSMPSSAVEVSPEDFHGDARCIQGNIEVVWANRKLRNSCKSDRFKQLDQQDFRNRLADNLRLSRFGNSGFSVKPSYSTFGSGVTRDNLLRPCFRSHRLPVEFSSLRASTSRNPMLYEEFFERDAADAGLNSDPVLGNSRQVKVDEFLNVGNISLDRTSFNSARIKVSRQDSQRYLTRDGNFFHRFASMIASNQVVSVRKFHFSGHVYDLQVDGYPLYACNGTVVHNCDCFVSYLDEDGFVVGTDSPGLFPGNVPGVTWKQRRK